MNLEEFLEGEGLKKVSSLAEVLEARNFLIDSNAKTLEAFPAYPVLRKAHLAHDLLNLYGTHWHYVLNSNWEVVERVDKDLGETLARVARGVKEHRHSSYAFTQKYLDKHRSLWVFTPEGNAWNAYLEVLKPLL